ncbi:MAG: GerMN domain-containing protein [Candidatus Nanopelagicales bacterium]|nr:GerMN domain-containing protein [Candidatus Nanopelagicales bacterium]
MKKYLLLIIPIILTACGSVPIESSIREGAILGSVPEGSIVRVIASNPQTGMTPEEIVSGFLNASASSDSNFKIAREYLIPELRNVWEPTEEIKVYEGQGRINSLQENTVVFSAPLNSVIDENSRIVLSEPDAQLVQEFNLKQIDNEWRIDLKNKGILISRADLNRSFTTFPLWFPDASLQTLVPDNVVLPRATTGNPTRLVQLLLAGPDDYLAGAVVSAFPVGTALALNSVPVSNGLATVSLNETVLTADPYLREVLSSQIVKTLAKIPEIKTVRINVGSQSLVVPNTPIRQSTTDWEKFSPDFNREAGALAIENGKIVNIDSESVSAVSDDYFNSGTWFAATANRKQNILAAVNINRTKMVVQNSSVEIPRRITVEGSLLRIPRTDIFDSVWITGVNQVSVVQNNRSLNVSIVGVTKQNVIEVIPSPDGVRVLLIVKTTYGTELRLGTIVREDLSIKINNLRKITRDGFAVSQATWQDETNVLYLDNSVEPATLFTVDSFTGMTKSLYSQSGTTNIASAVKKPLLLSLSDGSLLERVSGDWVNRGNLTNASYPG